MCITVKIVPPLSRNEQPLYILSFLPLSVHLSNKICITVKILPPLRRKEQPLYILSFLPLNVHFSNKMCITVNTLPPLRGNKQPLYTLSYLPLNVHSRCKRPPMIQMNRDFPLTDGNVNWNGFLAHSAAKLMNELKVHIPLFQILRVPCAAKAFVE